MNLFFFSFFLIASKVLFATSIDIITPFSISEIPVSYDTIKDNFTFQEYDLQSYEDIQSYENILCAASTFQSDKVFVWNYHLDPRFCLFRLPKQKLVYFHWEPWPNPFEYYSLYSRVYTWNDDLVDGVKFFKFYYPFLKSMEEKLPSFEDKKFCTLIASNWTPTRIHMIHFFETKPAEDFEFYGLKEYPSKLYRGAIAGGHSSKEKIAVLSKYRFCICFENTCDLRGYITEKIFACFAAGCVPIYWGALNIEEYIPKTCYIDYRDFTCNEDLYHSLKEMSKERYEHYLEAIRTYLKSEKAQLFSPANFERILCEAMSDDDL